MRLHRKLHMRLTGLALAAAFAGVLQGVAPPGARADSGARPPDTATASPAESAASAPAKQGDASRVLSPGSVLPEGWNSSADRAVTVAGDGSGLHLLAAASSQAYQWRTVATLSEPGFSTDLWVGNACVTGSGKRAVVVYAPREFTNEPQLMERGGFAAVVDLGTGAVTKLAAQVTLAYFDPGCGAGETATLTQIGDESTGADQTRLLLVDTATGKVTRTSTVPGEITSAVPSGDRIVGAAAGRLVAVDAKARATVLTRTSGAAFQLRADGQGGVSFLDLDGKQARAHRFAAGRDTVFAHGAPSGIGLQSGAGGRVFLTGAPAGSVSLPPAVQRLKVAAGATVSSTGRLAVDQAVSTGLRSHVSHPLAAEPWNASAPVQISTEVPATGKKVAFTAPADDAVNLSQAGAGGKASPALTASTGASSAGASSTAGTSGARVRADAAASPMTAGSPTDPIDEDRTCSIPRNDAAEQAYQPTPNQVEWAVDMAIRGDLTSTYVRQGGWRSAAGLGTVNPQGMFPLPTLTTSYAGGGRIPAQVLLGVLATESNLWQAEGGALPGQTSSPLASTAGFYGHPGADPNDPLAIWQINWDKTDCGYGIGQQTDGMKLGSPDSLPGNQQKAIALDYTSNIAVAARTLAQKWNELHSSALPSHIEINNDNPAAPENWFAALWDYNSGFNTYTSSVAYWGLGYLNNPANPLYPPARTPFLDANSYADAAHPQEWTYEEKVLGWGAWPIDTGRAYSDSGTFNDSNPAGYSADWWDTQQDRTAIKPPNTTFCKTAANACDALDPPRCEVDHLGASCDPPHWFHESTGWKPDCATTCGHEYLTYQTLKTELGNGNNGTGTACDNIDQGYTVIDDVSSSVPTYTDNCSKTVWSNAGTFGFGFNPDSTSHYEAKGDLHQIGGGFGDHFWYAHTRDLSHGGTDPADLTDPETDPAFGTGKVTGVMTVTGTWKLNTQRSSWARVMVHLPDTGSSAQQAVYTIHLGNGTTHNRAINIVSHANSWADLGVYHFVAGSDFQGVTLSNATLDGTADNDVSWDAIGFQWLPGKPRHIVASLGDSYSAGEGAGSYDAAANQEHGSNDWDACRRSANAWPRKLVLPGESSGAGVLSDVGSQDVELGFTACSGATSAKLDGWWQQGGQYGQHWDDPSTYGNNDGQFREFSQVQSGVLTSDTTLVTLTIGGNDDNAFSDAIQACATPLDCSGSDFINAYKTKIDHGITNLETVIDDIVTEAPKAQIVLVGYPEVLSRTTKCTGSWYFDMDEVADLATLVNYLDDQQQATVNSKKAAGDKIAYANPINAFVGHGGCDGTEWINKIVLGPNGDGDFHEGDMYSTCLAIPGVDQDCLSRESFHPNQAGTTGYEHVVEGELSSIGYTGGT